MKIYIDKLWAWLNTEKGILISFIIFIPLGLFLIWRNNHFEKKFNIVVTVVAGLFLLTGIIGFIQKTTVSANYDNLQDKYAKLQHKDRDLQNNNHDQKEKLVDTQDELDTVRSDYDDYQARMSPYEKLSDADAKKRQNDSDAADKVESALASLPKIDSLTSSDKPSLANVRKLYNDLTDDQKKLIDITSLTELETKMPEVEKAEIAAANAAKKAAADKAAADAKAKADQAAAAAKAAEEERRGYETGTTYDQLARTPDDFLGSKIKFTGKVIQLMDDGDSIQARLAVNDDYNNILLCDWSSDISTTRILEDDTITIYGLSAGLISYESTLGGNITIPSASVEKITR